MRSTGGARAEIYPQTTVSGVDPKVASGLFSAGAGCAAADVTETNIPSAAHQSTSDLETCFDIESRPFFANFFSTDCFEMIAVMPNPDRKFAGAQERLCKGVLVLQSSDRRIGSEAIELTPWQRASRWDWGC
jgi:hypothetical protein